MMNAVNRIALPEVDETRRRLGFWLRLDASRLLWPSRCLVCGEAGLEGLDLCLPCMKSLPCNRIACGVCAIPLAEAAPACGRCLRRGLRRQPAVLQAVHAPFVYAAPLDRLLPRFKFHNDLAAGRLLSQLMAQALHEAPRPDALVPLPLHRARLRRRGFDQALELARPLAAALGLPLLPDALVRVRDTHAQSTLGAGERRRNLRGAFAVPAGVSLPAHVALVDDVMTTGATLQSAALALRRAGATRVDAWVCARAP